MGSCEIFAETAKVKSCFARWNISLFQREMFRIEKCKAFFLMIESKTKVPKLGRQTVWKLNSLLHTVGFQWFFGMENRKIGAHISLVHVPDFSSSAAWVAAWERAVWNAEKPLEQNRKSKFSKYLCDLSPLRGRLGVRGNRNPRTGFGSFARAQKNILAKLNFLQ